MKNLIDFNGLWFYEGTSQKIMSIVYNNQGRENRLRFWYGDKETGKSWNEENDVCGYISRSAGTKKIPLLINNRNSSGGGALMTDSIVKIVETKTGRVLYQHDTFSQPIFSVCISDLPEYHSNVNADNETHARFKSYKSAVRYADFMNGKRMNK